MDVDRQDSFRLRRDSRFDLADVDAERIVFNVDENRDGVVMEDSGGSRPVGEGRDDDFVTRADSQGGDSHVQSRGAAVGDQAVFDAEVVSEFLLERDGVRCASAVEDVGIENRHDGVAVFLGDGRPAFDHSGRDGGLTAKNRQFLHVETPLRAFSSGMT